MPLPAHLTQFLASVHPYDSLPEAALEALSQASATPTPYPRRKTIFATGDTVESLYVIVEGEVEITDETGVQLSILGPRNSFGERALLRGGLASRTAMTTTDATLIVIPVGHAFRSDQGPCARRTVLQPPPSHGVGRQEPGHHAGRTVDDSRSRHLCARQIHPRGRGTDEPLSHLVDLHRRRHRPFKASSPCAT